MIWLIYVLVVVVVSGLIGSHLGRFRAAYTEMTGMMAGMAMGMLNGLVLGYAAAALTNSMFWGNLFGIGLGLTLGLYFGRPGGLMGVMDGAMGGVMGGSMGAMLEIMVRYPDYGLFWTAVLLGAIYVAGMIGLVVLIEQSAPAHAHLHRVAPLFTRSAAPTTEAGPADRAGEPGLVNYYEVLDIPVRARTAEVAAAYAAYVATADPAGRAVAVDALATLANPTMRARYDRELAAANGPADCCPPRRSTPTGASGPAAQTALRQAPAVVAAGAAATSPPDAPPKRLVDYYAFLGVSASADTELICDAHAGVVNTEDAAVVARAERALAVLGDPQKRRAYDQALAENQAALATAEPRANGQPAAAPASAVAGAVSAPPGSKPGANGHLAPATSAAAIATPPARDRGQGGRRGR